MSGEQKGRKKSQHKMINVINIDVNMASLGERKNVKGKGTCKDRQGHGNGSI